MSDHTAAEVSLDRKDRLLIAALRENSRASLVALAREIGLSRSATHDRIARLEEHGIVRGYTIRVDEERVDDVRAFLSLQIAPGRDKGDIGAKVGALAGVEQAYCLAGDVDMLVDCRCDNSHELGRLREKIAGLEGVADCATRIVLATHV